MSPNRGKPVGIKLSDRPRTYCPRANTCNLKDMSSVQLAHASSYSLVIVLSTLLCVINNTIVVRVIVVKNARLSSYRTLQVAKACQQFSGRSYIYLLLSF